MEKEKRGEIERRRGKERWKEVRVRGEGGKGEVDQQL